MEELLKQIISDLKTLEANLVTEITTSRVETEMTLRQIATYLSVSTQNLAEVHDIVLKFNTTMSDIKTEFLKINNIENELLKLPAETFKVKDFVEQKLNSHSEKINKYLENLTLYFKKILVYASKQGVKLDSIETSYNGLTEVLKTELSKNQDNLSQIIDKLIESKEKSHSNSTDIEKAKMSQDVAKLKIKSNLWIKILGLVIGSGGLIYVIIDIIMKIVENGIK